MSKLPEGYPMTLSHDRKRFSKPVTDAGIVEYLDSFLVFMRSAFARYATFAWFVIAFIGFAIRDDNLGVTSIVRALYLQTSCYTC